MADLEPVTYSDWTVVFGTMQTVTVSKNGSQLSLGKLGEDHD